MLSNHNPHYACKRFHHQHSLPITKRGGKYIDLLPPLPQGISISQCSLSSIFVDKSHICFLFFFWRLLIVLNRHKYTTIKCIRHRYVDIKRCWWPECTLCWVKSCLVFHQPHISSSTPHRLPIPNTANS